MHHPFMREFDGRPLEIAEHEQRRINAFFDERLLDCLQRDMTFVSVNSSRADTLTIASLCLTTSDYSQVVELNRVTNHGALKIERVTFQDFTGRGDRHTYKIVDMQSTGSAPLTRRDLWDMTSYYAALTQDVLDVSEIAKGPSGVPRELARLIEDAVSLAEIERMFDFIETSRNQGYLQPIAPDDFWSIRMEGQR